MKIASKVKNDLLKEKPELENDKIKLFKEAINYFNKNKSLYV